MTKGAKDAPKLDMPKPLVEKKAEEPPKPVEDAEAEGHREKELQVAKEAYAAARAGSHRSPIRSRRS